MTRKLIALLLCIAMIGSMTVYAVGDEPVPTDPAVTDPIETEPVATDPVVEDEVADVPETEPTYFEKVMAAESVEAMYIAFCADQPAAAALTADELDQLIARATELKDTVGDPSGDYDEFIETLEYLKGELVLDEEPVTLVDVTGTGSWENPSPITSSATWNFKGAKIHFKAPVIIESGVTLTITGYGTVDRDYTTFNDQELFVVYSGAKLIIEGTSESQPFIIDGNSKPAVKPLITASGELDFKNVVVKNGKNRSTKTDADGKVTPNGNGGGIYLGTNASMTMDHCVITANTASVNGGGIYAVGANATITNSTISWNRAMSSETGGVNAGRGGGFDFAGHKSNDYNSTLVLENVLVTENAAMFYGGGGQVSNGAKLHMKGNTVFSYNEAVLHGAGALHLTGDAIFTMDGGSLEYNKAQYCGGAIHSSYSCTLNLNHGTIKNNTSNGRGGGVHINTGGAIELGSGITISGNKVYAEAIGTYALVDETGDNWRDMKYEGASADFGYGGGILIDSGTCTVSGATITDNYAEVGGGGIALTMLNMHDGGLDDLMVIGFTMTSGTISNNTTDGNGAGVYIMTNKSRENFIKDYGAADTETHKLALIKINGGTYTNPETGTQTTYAPNKHGFTAEEIFNGIPQAVVSGGTIANNSAKKNGGGLFLGENTHFEISGGSIDDNKALNGAGAYVQTGTADINGGSVSSNEATNNGGALYVSGTVNMTAGTVKDNKSANGAGAFVQGGNFTMTGGIIDNNAVPGNGGGLYVDEGNFYMISGTLSNNSATGATSYGGGAYVTGGNVVIGVEDCNYTEENKDGNHTSSHTDKKHPVISNNTAKDSGGGLAVVGEGNITMYCGQVIDNTAPNRGRGLNVYMEKGTFQYVNGDLGSLTEPELVIVGGKFDVGEPYINLDYYHCNDSTHGTAHTGDLSVMHAAATQDKYINLPDGEKYWNAAEGYRFFGWTFFGPNDQGAKANVRKKTDYKGMGEPIIVQDIHDSIQNDKTISMYALWAPEVSKITYKGVVIDGVYTEGGWTNHTSNPSTYTFEVDSKYVTLSAPTKAGYKFTGWYIYQDLNQNANWGYEPVFKSGSDTSYGNLDFAKLKENGQYLAANADGTYILQMGTTLFGNITLIAEFEPAFTDLLIDKVYPANAKYSMDENQTFVFEISGTPYDSAVTFTTMTVVVKGDGQVQIKDLPVGTYTIKEKSEWSWRYGTIVSSFGNKNSNHTITGVELADPDEKDYKVTFTNTRTKPKWLSGDSWCKNLWGENSVTAQES